MIIAAVALAAAQVTVPGAQGLSVEQRVAALAEREAWATRRIESAIFNDSAMRAEVRRVGFAVGCSLVAGVGKEVTGRHASALRPGLEDAIRTVIPAQRMAEARVISFLDFELDRYRGRVEDALERIAAAALAAARDDMRRTFLERSRPIPTTTDPAANQIAPKADIAAALGKRGNWNLDNPLELLMACIERRISPSIRPKITVGETPQ